MTSQILIGGGIYKMCEKELVVAFSMGASEFLEEELMLITEKFGKISFVENGKYNYDPKDSHPHQWLATQEDCDHMNKLFAAEKDKKDAKIKEKASA